MTTKKQDQDSLVGSGAVEVTVAAIGAASTLGTTGMITRAQIIDTREKTKRAKIEAQAKGKK